jgi:uncharacterized repeat protein (TIGR01451 family)
MSQPVGLAFDSNGVLYVANQQSNTIVKLSQAGTPTLFANTSFGPDGLAFDSDGNLYAAINGGGIIQKFTPSGTPSTFATGLSGPIYIAIKHDSAADLSLTKILTTSGIIHGGDDVVFALTVTNSGPVKATGVIVTDALPPGLTYISNTCGATFANPTLTWNVGSLAPCSSVTCNLTVMVTQTGTITNTASATGDQSDPTPLDNFGTASVNAQQLSVLGIPTLDSAGLAALGVLLAVSAALALRRRRKGVGSTSEENRAIDRRGAG